MVLLRTALLALSGAITVAADYWVEPESVPLAERMAWCNDEIATCPIICQQVEPRTTLENLCDPETLTYSCLCGNNLQPNVSEYSLTLPYHVCRKWGTQCVEDCGSNNECASNCREQHPCGAQNPQRPNSTSSSATVSATPSSSSAAPDTIFTGLGGANQQTNPDSGAPSAFRLGDAYGLTFVMGALFVGFAML